MAGKSLDTFTQTRDHRAMAVARNVVRGARVIRAVAGRTLRFNVAWRDKDGVLIDSSDYTATLQIRDAKNTRRVILEIEESNAPNAVLTRYIDDDTLEERFLITLGKSYTSWLPEDCIMEAELVHTSQPDDVVGLFSIVLKVAP